MGPTSLKPDYQLRSDLAFARRRRCERGPGIRPDHERCSWTDGFTLPEAKSQVAWRDRDSVFVGTDFGPGSLTDSGYPRIVKEWKRGTPLAEAAAGHGRAAHGHERVRHAGSHARFRARHRGPAADVLDVRSIPAARGQAQSRSRSLATPWPSLDREWLMLRLRSDWKTAEQDLSGRCADR